MRKSRSHPIDTTMDLVAEENGAVNMISFNQSEANLRELLTHEMCSVISDGIMLTASPIRASMAPSLPFWVKWRATGNG